MSALLEVPPCEKPAPWPRECGTGECKRACAHNTLAGMRCPCCGMIFGCYCVEYPHPDNPLCPGPQDTKPVARDEEQK